VPRKLFIQRLFAGVFKEGEATQRFEPVEQQLIIGHNTQERFAPFRENII
jgi:hypothetical protein